MIIVSVDNNATYTFVMSPVDMNAASRLLDRCARGTGSRPCWSEPSRSWLLLMDIKRKSQPLEKTKKKASSWLCTCIESSSINHPFRTSEKTFKDISLLAEWVRDRATAKDWEKIETEIGRIAAAGGASRSLSNSMEECRIFGSHKKAFDRAQARPPKCRPVKLLQPRRQRNGNVPKENIKNETINYHQKFIVAVKS